VAPSVGRFEADFFDPVAWRPEYPNPAFDNLRADDAFWAARLVALFTDDILRAVVAKARYTDPKASEYVTATLIKRRDKVLREWLNGVNPVAEPGLSADGTLTFQNAAERAGVASPASTYTLTWSRFDNAEDRATGSPVEVRANQASSPAPASILQDSTFVTVDVRTDHRDHPDWAPVRIYFRRSGSGWQTVGLERTGVPGPIGYTVTSTSR
jgi:hypothetical protein